MTFLCNCLVAIHTLPACEAALIFGHCFGSIWFGILFFIVLVCFVVLGGPVGILFSLAGCFVVVVDFIILVFWCSLIIIIACVAVWSSELSCSASILSSCDFFWEGVY